jgi:hypothetical protein
MVNPHSADAQTASVPDDFKKLTVGIELPGVYGEQVRQAAIAAGVSHTKIARQILIAALEKPTQESLLQEIATLTAEVGYLKQELQVLQHECQSSRIAIYLTTELLLVLVGGLSPDEAHQVIEIVLAEGDGP